nr:hypothetical protein [Pseudomonas aeruginosa]
GHEYPTHPCRRPALQGRHHRHRFLRLGAEALLCVLLLAALWKTRQLDLD